MLDACIQIFFRISLYRVGGGRKFREGCTVLRGNREMTENMNFAVLSQGVLSWIVAGIRTQRILQTSQYASSVSFLIGRPSSVMKIHLFKLMKPKYCNDVNKAFFYFFKKVLCLRLNPKSRAIFFRASSTAKVVR